ncbi:MAG: hypothetical protein IIB55_00830 [Planctomycetes bacterium]|nr:hypothetical protein [Planctomycetota bacterium]
MKHVTRVSMFSAVTASSAIPALIAALAAWAPLAFPQAAHAQKQLWITQFGSDTNERIEDIGWFWGVPVITGSTTGDLGGASSGGRDAFLARIEPSTGDRVWVRQFGTAEDDEALAFTRGVVVGRTKGNLGGPNAGSGTWDAFVARYDENGNQVWIRQFGTAADDEALAVVVSRDIIVAGRTRGSLGGPSAGNFDVFLAGYDFDGNQLWMRQFGSDGDDSARALARASNSDGALVVGNTTGSLGGPNAGASDVFLALCDRAGNQLWVRQFGTPQSDTAEGVSTTYGSSFYVVGGTMGSLGGPSAGSIDAFVARYDRNGTQRWIRQFGTPEPDTAYSITPNTVGGVRVAGMTSGSLGAPNAGGQDAFVVSYDRDGEQRWARQFGTPENEGAFAITKGHTAGGYLVGGITRGNLGGPSAGEWDIFLANFGDALCEYADCCSGTGLGVLDIHDFLCFQNNFVRGQPYACDCDISTGPGVCDIFDFLCFQNAFVGGCH